MPPPRLKPRAQKGKVTSWHWTKSVAVAFGVLLFIAGMALVADGVMSPPGVARHDAFLSGCILLGAAVAVMSAAMGWLDAAPTVPMKGGLFYGVSAGVGLGIALFIRCFGMHQIGGFDHGALVDVGWRLANGQVPYRDFPCPAPVAFMLGAKFAFEWFGVFWSSIIDLAALFSAVMFAWLFFLLAQLFGRRWTTLLWAFTPLAMSMMLDDYWWYNPITAISASVYVFSAALWLHQPRSRSAIVSYGAALFLMATMKPNVAGVLVPLISVVLFSSPAHRWKTLLISAAAFGAFILLLYSNGMSFMGILNSYLGVARRAASIRDIYQFTPRLTIELAIVALVLVLLLPVVALCQGGRAAWSRGAFIGFIGLIGGLVGLVTDGEQKLVDLSVVLGASLVVVAELRGATVSAIHPAFKMPFRWNRYFSLICVILATTGIAQGIIRDRVKGIGLNLFFEYNGAKHTIEKGFFTGVQCGDIFLEVNREIEKILPQIGAGSVWFGPRMQWAYAAFQKPSPRGEPVWWAPGVSFPRSDTEFYFSHFLENRHDVLVLFKNDLSFFSQDMVQRLTAQYDVNQSFPLLTILVLKQTAPAASQGLKDP